MWRYTKEIAPVLHSLQAEVGSDIAASYPFDELVCNDEGKMIVLELNRGLRDEDGNLYHITLTAQNMEAFVYPHRLLA